jgi:hypothetical protein
VWQTGVLSVGDGTSNSLLVAGGAVIATNVTLGSVYGCNGLIELDGGTITITNSFTNGVLQVLGGRFIMNGGVLQVDRFVMTNACAQFVRNGGTLVVGSLVLDPNLSAVGDGIPNGWKQQYGFDPFDPSMANADPDGDGMSNLQEYLAGTDPTNSASAFRIISIATEGDDLRVMWTMGDGKTNALQAAAGGGGYGTNGFTDIFTVTNTVGTTTNYLDIGAGTNVPAVYYRVRLVP